MVSVSTISFRDGRPVSFLVTDEAGKVLKRSLEFWTIGDFCRRARKSRRQVYRDLHEGNIRPLGKFLGEWLIEPSELAALRPPPKSLSSLFPEYDIPALNLWRDRNLILARVLSYGGQERLRWALSFYGKEAIGRFIDEKGAKSLEPRSLRFWSLYFGLKPKSGPCFDPRWGGGA